MSRDWNPDNASMARAVVQARISPGGDFQYVFSPLKDSVLLSNGIKQNTFNLKTSKRPRATAIAASQLTDSHSPPNLSREHMIDWC